MDPVVGLQSYLRVSKALWNHNSDKSYSVFINISLWFQPERMNNTSSKLILTRRTSHPLSRFPFSSKFPYSKDYSPNCIYFIPIYVWKRIRIVLLTCSFSVPPWRSDREWCERERNWTYSTILVDLCPSRHWHRGTIKWRCKLCIPFTPLFPLHFQYRGTF